jgi:hypothetical protein
LIQGLEHLQGLLKETTLSLPSSEKKHILSLLKEIQHLMTRF